MLTLDYQSRLQPRPGNHARWSMLILLAFTLGGLAAPFGIYWIWDRLTPQPRGTEAAITILPLMLISVLIAVISATIGLILGILHIRGHKADAWIIASTVVMGVVVTATAFALYAVVLP